MIAQNSRKQIDNNKELSATLDSLLAKDQRIHIQWRESGGAMERELMNLTDDTVSHLLCNIMDRVGFISEDMIGIPLDEVGAVAFSFPFYVIMIHNYQSRNGDTLFTPLLRKALADGLIKPENFALIQDVGSNVIFRPYYGTSHFYVRYLCSIYLEKFNKERLDQIEAERSKIGLCNTKDQLKKIVFNMQFPRNEFKLNARASQIMSFADKKSEQFMLKNSETIISEIPDCKK